MPTVHVLNSINELPVWTSLRQCKDSIPCVYMYTPEMIISDTNEPWIQVYVAPYAKYYWLWET